MLVEPYANAVGGKYGEWLTKIAHDPYLVPSDSWKSFWLVEPQYRKGVYPQFGSCISCVSTLGKLANMCVRTHYYVTRRGLTPQDAVAATLAGQLDGTRHWMYGDDNRLSGPKDQADDFIAFMGEYFEIEEDEVPKYLGTIWRPDIGRFVLPGETYELKMYLKERDFTFSTYPSLGLVERRKTFSEFGEPEIASIMIPFEDQLFNDVDYPYFNIVTQAVKEMRASREAGITITKLQATDKDYLMEPEEQLASGTFFRLPADRTKEIVLKLVSPEIKAMFTFN